MVRCTQIMMAKIDHQARKAQTIHLIKFKKVQMSHSRGLSKLIVTRRSKVKQYRMIL